MTSRSIAGIVGLTAILVAPAPLIVQQLLNWAKDDGLRQIKLN